MASPDWSKKFAKPMNINLASELTEVSHHSGFEAVSDKWLHETSEEKEECTKPRKQAPTRQQPFKKGRIGISECSTHSALFLEKVFCGRQSRTTFTDVKKLNSSQCNAFV